MIFVNYSLVYLEIFHALSKMDKYKIEYFTYHRNSVAVRVKNICQVHETIISVKSVWKLD